MEDLEVGSKVRVKTNHWARSKARGTIVEIRSELKNPFLVEFKTKGIGIENGKMLWLSDNDLDDVKPL